MGHVISTVMTYALDGSSKDFNIPFEYLSRKFINVTLIGKDRKELVINTDYRFANKTTISLVKAWGPADGYQTIEIRRYTSATERLVDFTDGSVLRATDLNVAQIQTMQVAEEARDMTADTIGVNNDGNLDARGRRIVNVADPQDGFDASNLNKMKSYDTSALNSADKAAKSEREAATSANRAADRAGNAWNSEKAAKNSENNSSSSATLARKWASEARNVEVADGHYSAMSYSLASQDHSNYSQKAANDSKFSANAAEASKKAAKTSEDAAASSASKAKTEADKLGNMNNFANAIDSVQGTGVTMKGDFNAKGNCTITGTMSFKEVRHACSVNGRVSVYRTAPAGPAGGSTLDTPGCRTQLRGRGALGDAAGAYSEFFLREKVNETSWVVLDLNGFGYHTQWLFNAGGRIITPQGEVVVSGSDVRIKKDIKQTQGGHGERLDAIGIVEYTEITGGRNRRGVIAQQVDTIDPLYTHMTETAEGPLMCVDDRALLADLISEIQDLRVRIKELEDKQH